MSLPQATPERLDNGLDTYCVRIEALEKAYRRSGGELVQALDKVDLGVRRGEIVVLLGPSGCGKSTLLRCIGGLEQPARGSIAINGVTVFDGSTGLNVPPDRRDLNMMFQSYALWPHMTLEDNVAYPLRVNGLGKVKARRLANEYLALVGLPSLGGQYASGISGGQQQRVALARTLISEPAVVLLDEPLSNVDAQVRAQLRLELLRIHQELRFAAVYVTHDQIEAMGIGGRIAVMKGGRIDQIDDPISVYERPTSRYTAAFVGEANIFEATLESYSGNRAILRCALGAVTIPKAEAQARECRLGSDVLVMIRPEYCEIYEGEGGVPENSWPAVVDTSMYAGSRTEYHCNAADDTHLVAWLNPQPLPIKPGTPVSFHMPPEAIRVLPVEAVLDEANR